MSKLLFKEAGRDCPLCPRLVAFRQANRAHYPSFHNAPVPAFGSLDAALLIVGLAPGLKGANQTGRPFTNDYAGDLLYPTLVKLGLAKGHYEKRADDGLKLINTRITNAVRCVPPQNKPEPAEEKTCRAHFLIPEVAAMKNLKVILALGGLSHGSVLKLFGRKLSQFKFAHGAQHQISERVTLFDSYHCSRYNTNTGVLTTRMFEDVVGAVAVALA